MTSKRVTSESGSYMSQYDQEVEKRLNALEAESQKKPTAAVAAEFETRLSALEAKSHTPNGAGVNKDVETKLDLLISILKKNPTLNIEKLSGGTL